LANGWANLGRGTSKDEDAILEYASRMENGSAAPAPILWEQPEGYVVLDGVQRNCPSAVNGATRIATAYICLINDNLLSQTIRILANNCLSGRVESPEWTRSQIVRVLVIEGGMSIEEVARRSGCSASALRKEKD